MKLKYNAPTTLTFSLVCTVVLLVSALLTGNTLAREWFSVPGRGSFNFTYLPHWLRLFTYVLGHADWAHLFGNLSLLLLLGPILEQNYGSLTLLMMMGITAIVSGLINALVFPSGLMGASGIVFMMILLASFTNFGNGEIPVTFILVLVLFLGQEVWRGIMDRDQISQFAHILGGFCGSLFGFFKPARRT